VEGLEVLQIKLANNVT